MRLEQALRGISRKSDLLDAISDLEANENFEKVELLVRYYCVPGDEESQDILSTLMEDLVIDLYEKKGCRRDIDYCLMTE